MDRFLNLLSLVFMLLAVAAIVIFFAAPASRTLFYVVCGTAIGIRLLHYFIKFVYK